MYIPKPFRVTDATALSAFLQNNSFGTLVTSKDGVPVVSHLPIRGMYENGVCTRLVSHMARANPQWQHFSADTEALSVFSGPHGYVSPSWYVAEQAVPTWNYTAVHVYGYPKVIDDHDEIVSLLRETVSQYESSQEEPWKESLPDDLKEKLIRSIVAFEINVTRIEGAFKLGQNRSREDLTGVVKALSVSDRYEDRQLASFMASHGITETGDHSNSVSSGDS